MAELSPHGPALLILAVTSRYTEAHEWSRAAAAARWHDPILVSPRFEFTQTDYYRESMGPDLLKGFLAFRPPFDAGRLAEAKRTTIAWEAAYASLGCHPERRPINLDPGYLTAAKLVLASTKDHAHRVYLGEGIHAEVTLYYKDRRWRHWGWTYPDYRRADYQEFFTQAREWLRTWMKRGGQS